MTKELDLARGASMAFDMPVLLRRAINEYDEDNLTMRGRELVLSAKDFLDDFRRLFSRYESDFLGLIAMSGVDLDVEGYDD